MQRSTYFNILELCIQAAIKVTKYQSETLEGKVPATSSITPFDKLCKVDSMPWLRC